MAYKGALCKRGVLWFIGQLYAKNQGPNSKIQKVISLLSPFRDRQADIVASLDH